MRAPSRKLVLSLLLLAAWPLSSGCIDYAIKQWQSMIHFPGYNPGGGYLQGESTDARRADVQNLGSASQSATISFEAQSRVALCQLDSGGTSGSCLYNLNGQPISSTFSVRDNRIGGSPEGSQFIGPGYYDDPVILQVPADATVASATFQLGPVNRALLVTLTPSFQTGPGSTVTAEPGMTFLIVELPEDVLASITATDPEEGPQFTFSLSYSSADPAASALKVMLSVKVVQEGHPYYLPMLPCVTDFRQIPATTLPGSLSPESLLPALASLLKATSGKPCQGQLYDLRAIPAGGKVFLPSLTADD